MHTLESFESFSEEKLNESQHMNVRCSATGRYSSIACNVYVYIYTMHYHMAPLYRRAIEYVEIWRKTAQKQKKNEKETLDTELPYITCMSYRV